MTTDYDPKSDSVSIRRTLALGLMEFLSSQCPAVLPEVCENSPPAHCTDVDNPVQGKEHCFALWYRRRKHTFLSFVITNKKHNKNPTMLVVICQLIY